MLPCNSKFFVSSVLVALCSLALLGPGPTLSLANEDVPATWDAVQTAVTPLLEQEKIDEALAVIQQAAPKLPGREFEISDLTLEILFTAGRPDDAMTVWEKGLDDGYFYFVVPRLATYNAVRNSARFRTALARNNQLRDKANKAAKPEFKVITPASYSPKASYPLLMVIHGGNQSIVKAMGRWDPSGMGDDLIIAYVQSSRMADSKSYRWDLGGVDIYSAPTAQEEVRGLYEKIVGEYSVDTEQVTLAGFSQGGNLALIMAAEGTIPARGFVAGCPAIRSPIAPETAQSAAVRGLRGTIFVGSEDWTAAPVKTTVDNFNEAGLSVNHIVMEGKGHEFPENFEEVLREAIKQIHQ